MNFDKLALAYRGFCAYSLSQPNLLLIPVNTNIGVLQYNNNFYGFSTKEAAHCFIKNIGQYVDFSTIILMTMVGSQISDTSHLLSLDVVKMSGTNCTSGQKESGTHTTSRNA
jgi:hypothetical protein